MNADLTTLAINVLATPILVLLTMWVRASFDKDKRQEKREDGFIDELRKRVTDLERDIREVRAELKNRDAEYIELYKKYTTLKAQYEVLQIDHEKLTKEYDDLKKEMDVLKIDLKASAAKMADKMQVL